MEKILMYDDYGTTTYIELCTFSTVYRSTKIDSNWLKHPAVVVLVVVAVVVVFIGPRDLQMQ